MDSRHLAQAARRGAMLHLVPGAGNESTGGDGADGRNAANEGARVDATPGAPSFRRYPLRWVLGLNALTVAHYLVGCGAILIAYRGYPIVGWPVGLAYFVFAVVQLYVLMPLVGVSGLCLSDRSRRPLRERPEPDLGPALPAVAGRARVQGAHQRTALSEPPVSVVAGRSRAARAAGACALVLVADPGTAAGWSRC